MRKNTEFERLLERVRAAKKSGRRFNYCDYERLKLLIPAESYEADIRRLTRAMGV